MVIVHRDNGIYSLDPNSEYITELLWGFYYSKFEKILKSKNIPYKLGYYENYEGDYYIGRFAHAIPDKELHSEYFDDLYDYYGENMWPNKKAYYYYDDKIRQYELLEKYDLCLPTKVCNNLDELLDNVTVGTVVKSTYGAGTESILFIKEQSDIDNILEHISKTYNKKDFFPCQLQEFQTNTKEYKVVITNDEIYGIECDLIPERISGHWSNQSQSSEHNEMCLSTLEVVSLH